MTVFEALQQPTVQWQLVMHSSSLWCNDSLWGTPAAYGAMTACEALQQPTVQWQLVMHFRSRWCNAAFEALQQPTVQRQLMRHSCCLWCNDSLWCTPAAYGATTACEALQQPYGARTACEALQQPTVQRQLVRQSMSTICRIVFFYTSRVSKRYNATWFFTWML